MNFEEEMRFFGEWMDKDTRNEDYRNFTDSAQNDLRENIKVTISKGMNDKESKNPKYIKEKEMQQPVDDNKLQQVSKKMCQQEDKLGIETEKLRMLIMKVPQKRHTKVTNIVINRV